ncbi:endonuclease/exonuclease/phosphatase family protein [Streptomyces sp. TRM66268-LWL]|uniref:Endonuclease/exonuclease/phosphatase family protein n=1 Tax=Streptomyces polyasparticus TaxID=2767826 RepID=A0ABR7SGN2_9ACTN|nr:endonuclease/exonuclease/phosphatase family protein [Streptomyces polyasparticus]MBC9714558.1 endonuclease/exonuclease/phosphatase family protein [Streptomyces polyasparticus]
MAVRRRELLGLAGAAVGAGIAGAAPALARSGPNGSTKTLKVLQFNIWLGGSRVEGGRAGIADTIVATQPDVVMLSESNPERVANLLADLAERGLTFYDNKNAADPAVISRYPIIEQQGFTSWSKAVIDVDGTQIAAYSGHLKYTFYVNYLPRGYGGGVPAPYETSEYGWNEIPTGPITDVGLITRLNEASGRTAVTKTMLEDAAKERAKGRLVVLAGDFNEPSHRDWTGRTRNLFDHNGTVIEWSTTKAIEDAGFRDSYREIHPDPVRTPGFTWPSDNAGADPSQLTWAPKADERDRIDFVFYHPDGRLRLVDSVIVGPSTTIVRNERVEETGDDPFVEPTTWTWPTDHKCVLSTFRVRTGS